MISLSELNIHNYPTTPEIDANLNELLRRLNLVRVQWGQPMTITSGLRSDAQQQALIASGKSNAAHSRHLTGQAADIYDPDKKLTEWVKDHMDLMETIGFWFEDFDSTPDWIHFQIISPASGNRVFIP